MPADVVKQGETFETVGKVICLHFNRGAGAREGVRLVFRCETDGEWVETWMVAVVVCLEKFLPPRPVG